MLLLRRIASAFVGAYGATWITALVSVKLLGLDVTSAAILTGWPGSLAPTAAGGKVRTWSSGRPRSAGTS